MRSKYRKYHPDIKEMIIETRNPNLFPELNIPRTTALYWIKNAGKVRKKTAFKESKDKQKNAVANKLKQERYKTYLLSEVIRHDLKNQKRKGREKIVELFDIGKKEYGISYAELCRLIGIHVATLKQWRIDIHGCSYHFKKCETLTTNDLMESEKNQILKLLRDRKFAHFSLKSLCYYAKREGIVFASVSTCYKNMKLYQIMRKERLIF